MSPKLEKDIAVSTACGMLDAIVVESTEAGVVRASGFRGLGFMGFRVCSCFVPGLSALNPKPV